jgi:ribosomal protein S18 acetylase RimI-like enzyme
MSAVQYRRAVDADVPAMARIRAADWETKEYWIRRIRGYTNCELHPRQALPPRIIYVATEADLVLGLIAGHLTRRYECDGELEWIDVIPERRRTGVASELLRNLAAWFAEQKAHRVCVDVDPANKIARSFYGRHGAQKLSDHWLVWNDIRHLPSQH